MENIKSLLRLYSIEDWILNKPILLLKNIVKNKSNT